MLPSSSAIAALLESGDQHAMLLAADEFEAQARALEVAMPWGNATEAFEDAAARFRAAAGPTVPAEFVQRLVHDAQAARDLYAEVMSANGPA